MNRRMALLLTLFSGGLLPPRLLAQAGGDPGEERPGGGFRRARPRSPRVAGGGADPPTAAGPEADESPPPPDANGDGLPADFPTEPGQSYKSWDISRYVSLPHNDSEPQDALIEWIFRGTGSTVWHGEKIAVLSVSRAQLRAYHSPKVLAQVAEMVERFLDAQPSDYLKVRVRAVAASDTRWRYAVATRLTPIAVGEQGQAVWGLGAEDAAMIRTQLQVTQSVKLLVDQNVTMINGQTLTVVKDLDVEYVSGPQRESAVGAGFQPELAKLKEGVVIRLSPLLTYEGDAVDVALNIKADTARRLYPTRILTRREMGPVDMTIDVVEMSGTRFNQTIQGWKLGQTLLISAGIHPGILQSKTGFLNLRIPGTVPTRTELLVFLDIEPVNAPAPPRTARDRVTEQAKAPAARAARSRN